MHRKLGANFIDFPLSSLWAQTCSLTNARFILVDSQCPLSVRKPLFQTFDFFCLFFVVLNDEFLMLDDEIGVFVGIL